MSTTPAPTASTPTTAPAAATVAPAPTPAAAPKAPAKAAAKAAPAAKAVKPVAPKAKKPAAKPAAAAKAPASPKAPKAAKPAKVEAKAEPKPKKAKLVRDSFTIPKPEYLVLDDIKQRAQALARPVKKSEILRAGIKSLAALSDAALLAALAAVPAIKTGRPSTEEAAAQDKPAKKTRNAKH